MMEAHERHEEVTHADDVVRGPMILKLLFAMLAISFALCVLAYLLLVAREAQLRPTRAFPEQALGAPRSVAAIRVTPFEPPRPLPALDDAARARLGRYEWVDKAHGTVRIPIERAMDVELRQIQGATR